MKTVFIIDLKITLHAEERDNIQSLMASALSKHAQYLKDNQVGRIGKHTIPLEAEIEWKAQGYPSGQE